MSCGTCKYYDILSDDKRCTHYKGKVINPGDGMCENYKYDSPEDRLKEAEKADIAQY